MIDFRRPPALSVLFVSGVRVADDETCQYLRQVLN
jgi:hypothetical protein